MADPVKPGAPALVNVVGPKGEEGSVKATELARAKGHGAREMTDAELASFKDTKSHENDAVEGRIAGTVGKLRGLGEVAGLPLDAAALSVADLFGKKEQTRGYLQGLQKYHPIESGYGELAGQVGGGIAGGELLGGLGLAGRGTTAIQRIGANVAEAAARGGLENLVVGSTSDVNEAVLGDHAVNGEKLFANAPKHFLLGGAAGGLLGGGAAILGEGATALAKRAPEALEAGATRLVGREMGGDAAMGRAARDLAGGGIPGSRDEIASLFGKAQGETRAGAEAARAQSIGDIEGRQTIDAGRQAAEHEAGRLRVARSSQGPVDEATARYNASKQRSSAGVEQAAGDAESAGIDREWGRVASHATVQDAVDSLAERHATVRDALSTERGKAVEAADLLLEQSGKNAEQLKLLAGDLDKVPGADVPKVQAIIQASHEAVGDSGVYGESAFSATPATRNGLKHLDTWLAGFQNAFPEGEVSFVKMGEVIGSLEHLSKSTKDPIAKGIFGALADSSRAEFDRASAATAAGISEASTLGAERLRSMAPDLAKSHEGALAEVAKHDRLLSDFEKHAAGEMAQAESLAKIARGEVDKVAMVDAGAFAAGQKAETGAAKKAESEAASGVRGATRDAGNAREAFEETAAKEKRNLGKAQKAELGGVPKASTETPYDGALDAMAKKAAEPAPPLISPHAAMVGLWKLASGNIPAAALTMGGSLVAGQLKAKGNLVGARILHAVADQLTSVDRAIARGATRAVRGAAVETGLAGARKVEEATENRRTPTYEKVTAAVRAAQANPQQVEMRLRNQMGAMVDHAPATYGSALACAQRAQNFLAAAIPSARVDPFSPTAHLEPNDVSEAERYDYMQYVHAIDDPIGVLRATWKGDVTDQQVAAVREVYPGMYQQMRTEVQRSLAALQTPMQYERAISVGTLLDMPTTEVMLPKFQREQASMYAARLKEEEIKPGSPPAGPNGRMSKSTMSGSQQTEFGDK